MLPVLFCRRWWVQFYAPYSTESVNFKKTYKQWAKTLRSLASDENSSIAAGNSLASVAGSVNLGAVNCEDHRDFCADILGSVDDIVFPALKVFGS